MAIYTGVADANGDFTVPFSSNYTGGQKITVIAEKDSATKSIDLYAPSEVTVGGSIQFSGTLVDFPSNVGNMTLTGFTGKLQPSAFEMTTNTLSLSMKCSGLSIGTGVTEIGSRCFYFWRGMKSLVLPDTLTTIQSNAFYSCRALLEITIPNTCKTIGTAAFADCTAVKKVTLGSGLTSLDYQSFESLVACDLIVCLSTTPPTIQSNTFSSLKSTCIFQVPASSIAAYKAAANWSAFASRIQAI